MNTQPQAPSQALRSRRKKVHAGKKTKPDARLEVLEARIAPAFTSTVAGSVASFVGDAASDTLTITESGGFLMHNHAGDAGFNSALDFDSVQPGDQTLAVGTASIVNVNGGGGIDIFTETRSTGLDTGVLNLPGGSVVLTSTGGGISQGMGSLITTGNFAVHAAGAVVLGNANDFTGQVAIQTTGASQGVSIHDANALLLGTFDGISGIQTNNGAISITADNLDIQAPILATGQRVTIVPSTLSNAVNFGGADAAGTLGITDAELGQITAGVVQVGILGPGGISGGITISSNITRHAGFDTLAIGASSPLSQSAPLSVANLAITSSVGGVVLTNAGNDVDTLAALVGGGGSFSYTDANALVIGTADTRTGVFGNNLTTLTTGGSLTLNKTVEAGFSTVTLDSDGPVTQAAGDAAILAPSLLLLGAGSFDLNNAANDVDTLAANTGGSVSYTSGTSLSIGSVSGTNGITVGAGNATLTTDSIAIQQSINVGAGRVTLQPRTAGSNIDLGGADAGGTLGLTDAELDIVTAGVIQVGSAASGSIKFTAGISPAGSAQLELVTGASIEDNFSGTDVTVARLAMTAGSGIGVSGLFTYLDTQVSSLEAQTDTGGISIANGAGDLTIGGVTAALTGLKVVTSGEIHVNDSGAGAGNLILADTDGLEAVRGGTVSGNIFLSAIGATSDITRPVDGDAVTAPGGSITLNAGRDIVLGNGAAFDNDVRASGNVTFIAGRNLFIAGFSDIASDDFGASTGGFVSLSTVDGDITISSANGNDSSVTAGGTAGGSVAITAGTAVGGHLFTNQTLVSSASGGIVIRTDAIDLQAGSAISAINGEVNIRVDTAGVGIDLGSTAVGMALSQTEINTISAAQLRLTAFSDVTLSQPVTFNFVPTLSLEAAFGGVVDATAGEQTDLTVSNLAITSGNGIGSADDLDIAVSKLAFNNNSGAVSITNTGALTVDDVAGLGPSVNSGTTTQITAASPLTLAAGITSAGTVTLVAGESNDAPAFADDLTILGTAYVQSTGGDVILAAGDDIIIQAGGTVQSVTGAVTLNAGAGDLDGSGSIQLFGDITALTSISLTALQDVGIAFLSASEVTVTSRGGAILDLNDGVTLDSLNIQAVTATLTANHGIGVSSVTPLVDASQAPLEVQVDTLIARNIGPAATGDIHLVNVSGNVSATARNTAPSGVIDITAAAGGTLSLDPISEIQDVTVTGAAGTFTLTFNGDSTGALAFNASAAAVQAALEALPSIGVGNVIVTLADGVYRATFTGALALTDTTELMAAGSGGATANVATIQNGGIALESNDGNITASADRIAINGAIFAGTGAATLHPNNVDRAIDLGGADSATALGLSDAELDLITAGVVRVGDPTATGIITVTAPITAPGGWSTLSLLTNTNGSIGQTGAGTLTVSNLLAAGAQGVTLTNPGNAVGTLAGASLGAFSFTNSSSLTIGTVDAALSVPYTDGIKGGGPISITLVGAGDLLTVDQPITSTFFAPGDEDITLTADDMAINAAIAAGSSTVSLLTSTFGRSVDLGTDSPGSLGLTDAELDQITAGRLIIGNSSTGNVVASAAVSIDGAPLVSVYTGASITSSGGGSIAATNLALHAVTGIGSTGTPLAVVVENLAFVNTSGAVNIANTGHLTITSVDDLATSANYTGTTTLSATAGAGPTPGGIVFAVNTYSYGTLTANAVESPQPEDDIRVQSLVNVTSETGDIIFNAGDGIIAEENSVITAKNEVKLSFGYNDLDGSSFIDLRGFISARILTLQASIVHESITLGTIDNIDVQVINIRTGADNTPDTVTLLDSALSHEINASLRLGGYISVLGFTPEIRIFETTTADTLILAGREGDDTITAQSGVETKVNLILDGGAGDDILTGNGTLVGGEGNDELNGGLGNDVLLGDGGVEFLYGLATGNILARFSSEAPDTLLGSVPVTGLVAGDDLVGIDVRPADGKLYALGVNTGVGHIYTIDPLTGAATLVGTLTADPADATSPFTVLTGSEFGVDFNPVADRLRVVSNTGQNLRINVDTALVTTDGDLNPGSPNAVGVAYSNSFAASTGTTLYTIDATTDQLFIQNPPNNGTLTAVGFLGVDVDAVLGFDIVPGTGTAYAALVVGGVSGLYTIDLVNGVATIVAPFGGGATIRGLAVGFTQGNDIIHGGAGDDLLVGGAGNDQLLAGVGNDRLDGGAGDDLLDGGDGDDSLAGGTGNDILSGGLGADHLDGGLGVDLLRESRDADFMLTNSALTIGTDAAETLTGIESVDLTGGIGANAFNIGAFTGQLKVTGGDGSDTLDYSASSLGVSVDLDAVGGTQFINSSGAKLILGDIIENFAGSAFNDIIQAKAQSFARTIVGGAPSTAPGLPGASVPPGDVVTIDGRLQFVTTTKLDPNTGTISIPGFGAITYDDIEKIVTINSSSTGGFGGSGRFENGATAFTAGMNYRTGKLPRQVVTGDVNGDGLDDIVTVNTTGKSVSVLLARPNGTFDPALTYSTGGLNAVSVALGNVDDDANAIGGDNDLDIIVLNSGSNKVAVLLNDGAGNFGTPTSFGIAAGAGLVRVGDFNQDGLIDIATLSKASATISVLLNNGGGMAGTASFGSLAKLKTGGKVATDFQIGNFDGDPAGALDFAVSHSGSKNLTVLLGDGLGGFTLSPTKYAIKPNSTVMALADFNNDGNIDVVVNYKVTRAISVLLGRGNAGGALFEPMLKVGFGVPIRSSGTLITGDFDGDGNADLAFGSESGAALRVALGTGTGLFQSLIRFSIGNIVLGDSQTERVASSIAVGDFNGDGALDVVVSNRVSNDVTVVIRNPTV